jgi:chromosome segregation protein
LFLRRVSVTGFKSFANKTVLELEPGITGVVGPNGSGKSNIADAVRWALGEQSKGRLRLTDREEVIFAGTTARAKASFAEVTLLFNNEDGAFPLDLTEVEISRRLYRSGETDYRLAGRAVRLADIQTLLAQAGFGVGTYAVIGQGMIDSLLLSSPAERKLLFDEAAGIRGPELGREAARRKLERTAANLTRLRDIAAELAPRLTSLQTTAVTAAELGRLEQRVRELRQAVAAAGLGHWAHRQAAITTRRGELEAGLERERRAEAGLEADLAEARAAATRAAREQDRLQRSLAQLETRRDQLAADLAGHRANLTTAEHGRAELARLRTECQAATTALTATTTRRDELAAELASNADAERRALRAVEKTGQDVAAAQAALVALRKSADDGTRDQYLDHALQLLKTIARQLAEPDAPFEQTRLLVHKAGRLLSHATRTGAAELLAQVKAAQKRLETAMAKRETAIEHQTNVAITGRSLEIDLAHQEAAVTHAHDHHRQLEAALAAAETTAASVPNLTAGVKRLHAAFIDITAELDQRREQVRSFSAASPGAQAQIELAGRLERARAAVTAAEAGLARLAAEQAEAAAGLAAVHEQSRAWDLSVPDVPAASAKPSAPPTPPPTPPALAHAAPSIGELQSQLVRAETLLESRTATAHDQSAELEQVSTRHAELMAQITDLESAKTDLEKVIAELDTLIRSRFKDNFQALSMQFSTYFARLFEGGSASLELTEADDGAYGIIIKASPKGKRLTSIAALSGGERALAGVALLAAILRVNPSPFVVLDEIDAALDEANSGRLAGILAELKEHSQLIVITHNRQTMQAARVLFGVTINEHHVSHLLSLRLEDATALAAR